MTRLPIVTAAAMALAACQAEPSAPAANGDGIVNAVASASPTSPPQRFALTGATGEPHGSVTISESAGGINIAVAATGLPPGVHGIHLHETGACAGPKFDSAGKHWNPAAKQHGRDNPAGAHLGDLVNLTIDANGSASTSFPVAGASMAGGAMTLADADGTALVIHAKADDYRTDPSGDSGDRVACAVLAAGR